MSTRLQVVVSEEELRELKAAAAAARMTVSEWVRQSLREARSSPRSARSADLEEVFAMASQHRFPAPDVGQMNDEIARGYLER